MGKSRRLRCAIRMFKLNMDIRIKRRAMLRNAHVEYHENMQNLLCTQWLKVYSEQMESKSRNRRSGPFGRAGLASLDRRRVAKKKGRKYASSNIKTSIEDIIETHDTRS